MRLRMKPLTTGGRELNGIKPRPIRIDGVHSGEAEQFMP